MYLEVTDVKKSYGKDSSYIQVLKGITTGVERGQMCVIQGTSGSGKSTLLNCIGGLDTMDSGSVKVDGVDVRIRYVAPIVVSVVLVALMAATAGVMLWAFYVEPENAPPLGVVAVMEAVPLLVIAGVLLALFQRMKEISKGEIDDAKQY